MSSTKRTLENKQDDEPPAKRQKESSSNSNSNPKQIEKNKDDVKESTDDKKKEEEEIVYTVWLKRFGKDESGKQINEHRLLAIYKSILDANKHGKKMWAKETKEYMEDDPDGMGESYDYENDENDEQEDEDDDIDQTEIDPFCITTEDFMAYNRNLQVMIGVVEYPLFVSFSPNLIAQE